MKLILFSFAAICIVSVNCGFYIDNYRLKDFRAAAADLACASGKVMEQSGWLKSDGTPSDKLKESEAAKECRELVGDNACDTTDKVLLCLRNKGLETAVSFLPTRVSSH